MAEQIFSGDWNKDDHLALATIPRTDDLVMTAGDTRSEAPVLNEASSLGTADERRIVTILFCDVVGSTTMAESLDPEEWAEIMHEAFEYLIRPIERYGGTVARLMGDAVLAFFGAPETHEDDPQRAILAGLDIVDSIQPFHDRMKARFDLDFNVRVGINTGLVVVGDFGARDRFEYTAMGDAINLAARIQELARPGTVQVASATYRLAAPLFEFEPLGDVDIRGKARRESVYRVIRASAIPGHLWDVAGLCAPLIGRDDEMALIRRAYDELQEGRGQIILIVGDAGLGKSRLLEELRQYGGADRLPADPEPGVPRIAWLENRLLSYEAPQPYGALEQRVRRAFGIDGADSPEVVQDKVGQRVKALPTEFQDRAIRVVERILAAGRQGDHASLETTASGLDADTFKREMYSVMLEMLRNWNRGGPVVFIGDDLHWSDPASSDLNRHVLQLVEQMPILFVSAFRPDEHSPAWRIRQDAQAQYADRCTEIRLHPLPEPASEKLLDALVEIPEEYVHLRELILTKADGVPLFIEEIVRSLVDQGALEPTDEHSGRRWRPVATIDVSSLSIPDSIQALMLQRVDRLDVETRRILQHAAVVGRMFPLAVLQSITRLSRSRLRDRLASLERLGLIFNSGAESDDEYSFRQPLMWEVVYSTMLRRQRREVHRRVAEALQEHYRDHLEEHAASLGHHFFEAGDTRAIAWLLRASERARSVYEPKAVIEYVTMAERLARDLNVPLPAGAYQARGLAHELVGDYQSARDDFQQAIERAQAVGNLRDEWQALISLGMAWAERDYSQAGNYYRRALERARQLADEPLLAHSLNRLGNWYSNTGVPDAAFQAHRDAVEIFERLGDARGLAESRDLLGMACYLAGDLPAAADYFNQSVTLFRDIDDRQGLVSSLAILTVTHGSVLDLTVSPAPGTEGVTRYAAEALAVAREIDWEAGVIFAEFTLALAAQIRGDYGDALEHVERARHLAEQIGHRQWTVAAHVGLGAINLDLFQLADAERHLEQALPAARRMGSDNWINTTGGVLAEVYLAAHDLERARELLESFPDDGSPPGTVARRGRWYRKAAVELEGGNAAEALAIIDLLVRTAPDHDKGMVIPHLALLRGQALARLGRYQEAEQELQNARSRATDLGYRPVIWRIDLALAELRRDQGDRGSSVSALARARDIIDELAAAIDDQELQNTYRRGARACLEGAANVSTG